MRESSYPGGKEFAFTILDDTDDTTVKTGKPVYDYLYEKGVITTKTVWALDPPDCGGGIYAAGSTLQDLQYRDWVRELSERGYEIAFHNATMVSSKRKDTEEAISLVENLFGRMRLHCNHGQNAENLFWGYKRYETRFIRQLIKILGKQSSEYYGDVVNSDFYWLDLASEKFDYIRSFTFRSLLYAESYLGRPYKTPSQNWGGCFFTTADAPTVYQFNRVVNEKALDKLARNNGYAIVSTHLGKGFYADGRLNKEFKRIVDHISDMNGWFVPVSELLDYLRDKGGGCNKLSELQVKKLELQHVCDRVLGRLSEKVMPSWSS